MFTDTEIKAFRTGCEHFIRYFEYAKQDSFGNQDSSAVFEYEDKKDTLKSSGFKESNERHKKWCFNSSEQVDNIEVDIFKALENPHQIGRYYSEDLLNLVFKAQESI